MPPKLLYPGQLELPFLNRPGLSISSSDPQRWAQLVSSTIPVSVCEPLRLNRSFRNRTAVVDLGTVTAMATHGSAISVCSGEAAAAQLLLPYRGNGWWQCDGRTYENPVGESVLFVPPTPLRLENSVTSGVSLSLCPDRLMRTAHAMAGPEGIGRDLGPALSQPKRLLWHEAGQSELIECLYRTLTSADRALAAAAGALPLLRLDDLLMRLTVLLLVPELRWLERGAEQPRRGPSEPTRLQELTAWIDAHLDQPIGLSDLERQAGCSRRTLQYLFRQRHGCTPMQWLRRRRLERAMEHLRQAAPGQTVWQVAQACGYTNLASFSRDFGSWHGQRASEVLHGKGWRSPSAMGRQTAPHEPQDKQMQTRSHP